MKGAIDINSTDLAQQFCAIDIERGDSILVHSSLSSLGWIDGGAMAVIDALIESVGEEGTVLFPTLTRSQDDSPETPPKFDARSTPCWTGAIPEASRSYPGARRSLHPSHSVTAIGRLAEWFTSGHQFARTPCGYGSPYDKLADIGGKIVLIGVKQNCNTSFHMAEEIAGVPYVVHDVPMNVVMTDMNGSPVEMRGFRMHAGRFLGEKAGRDYNALEPQMIEQGICRIGRVDEAEVRIMDAMLQRKFLVNLLLRDPLAVLGEKQRGYW
jgi:aminoglycoside 3-N-acetyltransferase